MASNSFGTVFRITTWGESHGKAIGVVVDGCPAGIEINEQIINSELAKRAPGNSRYTSPRAEKDQVEIYSGVFEGLSTGAPISLIIPNRDVDSSKYESIKNLVRPGHANYTYFHKYGHFDHRGGGRSSGRETACRVAAGAIAKQLLKQQGITLLAFIKEIGDVAAQVDLSDFQLVVNDTARSPVFCPDVQATARMTAALDLAISEKDSLGGVVELHVANLPIGWGEPIYEKLEAKLAAAMLSIPASKGFEIGSGFQAARMRGSEHNDRFEQVDGRVKTTTNHAGGVLGGISIGMPLVARVAFKPTSSIGKAQATVDFSGENTTFNLPEGSRHDPCLAIRAVAVVEAMTALVLADLMLMS